MNVPAPKLLTAAAGFIDKSHELYINGEWVKSASEETIDVIDPATGGVIAKSSAGGKADVDKAVAAARAAFETGPWASMTGMQHGRLITKLAMRLEELADELAEIEAIDCGKPVTFAKWVDVGLTATIYHYYAGWASKVSGETVSVSAPGDYHAYTLREPVGVVAAIGVVAEVPWQWDSHEESMGLMV